MLVQHGLRVRGNIYHNGSLEILADSTTLHDAHMFVLQVHRQGLKHMEGVREKWNVYKGALDNAGLRVCSRAESWTNGSMAPKGTHQPPETLSKESFGVIEQETSGMFGIVWLAGWPKRTEASRAGVRHCCVPKSTGCRF